MHTSPHNSDELQRAEQQVEAHSRALKQELGLFDLVLTQILFIVGLVWVGVAGKLGQSHIVFWLLAILLFYVPSAVVVSYLNRLMPLEGGLYQWAKLGFNEATGFLVGWNLWLYVITLTAELGLQAATMLSYAFGAPWMATAKWFITALSCVLLGGLTFTTVRGLGVGKWVHNAGGIVMLVLFAALFLLPIFSYTNGAIATYQPFALTMPTLSLFSLNILSKLGFGALGGFEYVAILAGECREPERTINRSVWIAAPIIALIFILGTSSMIALVPPEQIDLIGPIPQALSVGARPFGLAARIVPIAILCVLWLRIGQASINFTANARLPMVAGWDALLPQWFTRLHPRHRTPINSILLVGALTLGLGLASLIGAGNQEAFQLLWNGGAMFYALTYLVMFAIPLFGLRGISPRPPVWLRIAAASGFLMTLLNVIFALFPIIHVANRWLFAGKLLAVIVGANVLGGLILLAAARKRAQQTAASAAMPTPLP